MTSRSCYRWRCLKLLCSLCPLSWCHQNVLPLVRGVTAQPDHNYVRRPQLTRNAYDAVKSSQKKKQFIPQAAMTVPMHYESGSHHIYVWVGSPKPQKQILILDTGSRYMAFPCEPCPDCGSHASAKYFDDKQSSTHRDNYHPDCVFATKRKKDATDDSCNFDQTYLEGSSWKAKEVEDLVWLATADEEESVEVYMPHMAIPFTFGCQNHVTGYFVHQVHSRRKLLGVCYVL